MHKFVFFFTLVFLAGCYSPGLHDYSFDLPGGYNFARTSSHILAVYPNQMIPPKIMGIAWDEQYVFAEQHPLIEGEPDESQIHYWILDTESQQVFGPLDKGAYAFHLKLFSLSEPQLKHPDTYDTFWNFLKSL